jgi:hypothetical protein
MKLPIIIINNLITSRMVEWERLEFKAGWKTEVTPEVARLLNVMTSDHSRNKTKSRLQKYRLAETGQALQKLLTGETWAKT